ncbi:T9SS type A sorting domain-containing protein [bacterium]|nr:T9SS type A sorting domain-containing protein [bacterium]
MNVTRAILVVLILVMPLRAQLWDWSEPFIIALTATDSLLPSPALLERVEEEYAQIVALYPGMDSFWALPDWAPGMLIVRIADSLMDDLYAGEYHGLDSLNAIYGLLASDTLLNFLILEFEEYYNPIPLVDIYESAYGATYAEPNWSSDFHKKLLYSFDVDNSHYIFDYRWGDCPAGCANNHEWHFLIENGLVDSIYHFGDPVFHVDFTQDHLSGFSPLTVSFTDWSLYGFESDSVELWAWDFDNDGTIDSHDQYPSYTFQSPGLYTVQLAVGYGGITHEVTKSDHIDVFEPVSIEKHESPQSALLLSNFPNPFNPNTTIQYELPERSIVTLSIYDISGRNIQTLVDEPQTAGHYETQWKGTDETGKQVSAGMYFVKLQAGDNMRTIKMVYLR